MMAFTLTIDEDIDAKLIGEGSAARIELRDRKSGTVLQYGHLFALDADGKELPAMPRLAPVSGLRSRSRPMETRRW